MRVRLTANPPLPPLKAWFPLNVESAPDISSLKRLVCASIPAFSGLAPASLHLAIDGFELLDNSELSVVKEGDLICINERETSGWNEVAVPWANQKHPPPEPSRKRKRPISSSSSSSTSSTSDTSESESDTSGSESDPRSSRPTTPPACKAELPKTNASVSRFSLPKAPAVQLTPRVPPGHGKPQTRSRNLRRRLKRQHERVAAVSAPVSGANAVEHDQATLAPAVPPLMSLSLRSKNKAKNFRSLIKKPLPPKIVFGDQEGDASAPSDGMLVTPMSTQQRMPQLIPPSSRTSLPPNVFVTSVDVEAGLHKKKRKRRVYVDCGEQVEGDSEEVTQYENGEMPQQTILATLESIADKQWHVLKKFTRDKQVTPGTFVGYKGLGIHPVTCTPEQLLTFGRIEQAENHSVMICPIVHGEHDAGVEDGIFEYAWEEIEHGDWRIINIPDE